MGSQVAPQVDVGSLTLNGLSAFGPLLASLSADNVQPMAMIQMENLGALFHINGQYAKKVPDLLQRFSSTRLDRLGMAIGWRKGDAASLMANSAGGQAISLLSMCLVNLYRPSDIGEILHELSRKVLPTSVAISSVLQLSDIAQVISGKLQILGFGNILARQIIRIHDAYECLGIPAPNDLLNDIPTTTAVDLFESLTRALREESTIVRISGSHSIGYILGIVMIMFPEDSCITLEGLILHEGLRNNIIIEIKKNNGPTRIQGEFVLRSNSTNHALPISIMPRMRRAWGFYHFTWMGWIADKLDLEFAKSGLTCSEDLRVACCCLILCVPEAWDQEVKSRTRLQSAFLFGNLLGSYPLYRMQQICMTIWRVPPHCLSSTLTLQQCFLALVGAFSKITAATQCTCTGTKCDPLTGFHMRPFSPPNVTGKCLLARVWMCVSICLGWGVVCLLVNANEKITIIPEHHGGVDEVVRIINNLISDKTGSRFVSENVQRAISSLLGTAYFQVFASSSVSSTIYLTGIQALKLPQTLSGPYNIVDGRLMLHGRYHGQISDGNFGSKRPRASLMELHNYPRGLIPSSLGMHSDLQITLAERFHSISMKAAVRVGGANIPLSLTNIILQSWGLEEAASCQHPTNIPLEENYASQVITTSVAAPAPPSASASYSDSGSDSESDSDSHADSDQVPSPERKIAIALVQSNETAQLLCCERGVRSLLQKDCCLNCAFEEALARNFDVIICG